MNRFESSDPVLDGVAIVGVAGRFPGASGVPEFWRNQLSGKEAVSQFRVEELEVVDAAELAGNADYIRARSILDDVDKFDAEFFGIYPREAELMDPQHRLFLECCWQAFEDAGYDPFTYAGQIGVYAGSSLSTYFLSRLCATDPRFVQAFVEGYQVANYPEMMGNSLDFLSTRVSYKLNLRGPSFTIQSACSTSLLAVTQACQSLLTFQSDMALAGGVSITFPQKRGYLHQEGGMVSPDGHCRTFDADAQGTIFGSGAAVVLLKRVEDAIKDGDQIYAVIRGFGVNNDGAAKVGYTAPSVEGQASAIALAHEAADVRPETIGYIEAHGTGTPLGDPIELTALTQAFRAGTDKKQFCVIGSAKTNVGHLDIAAGVTGMIHAAHVVRDGVFPPTLHYRKPNPKFDLDNSPFRVSTEKAQWKSAMPRRAGVSAFGVGGTNVHLILEQAPRRDRAKAAAGPQLLVLSARSATALDAAGDNLAAHLEAHPDLPLSDVAWTLQVGRRAFPFRRSVVAASADDAVTALSKPSRGRSRAAAKAIQDPAVCFLFPGQGSQHPFMAHEIYQREPVFRDAVDRCAEILRPHLDADLRTLLYPRDGASEEAKRRVTDTVVAQPAIFTIEYALAQLWMSWGVRPRAMLGHSIGEFAAACLAGVFSLEDALALVATRGRMMQDMPAGGMLSVRAPEADVRGRLKGGLSIAAVNSPSLCVVAGPHDELDELARRFEAENVACRRLVTSHAFHSSMMEPLIEPLTAAVAKMRLRPPQMPYVSGVTGTWVTEAEATDPAYWARHAREPVQFSRGVTELLGVADSVLLEVGPGIALGTLARQHADRPVVSSLSDGFSGEGDAAALLSALGALWSAGVSPNWQAVHGKEQRRRISLPTYPFERKRFWLEATSTSADTRRDDLAAAEGSRAIESAALLQKESVPVHGSPQSAQVVSPGADGRRTRVLEALADIFAGLSGVDLGASDSGTTFLELGFDSLFLTQVSQALQSKFGLKITFRQLLGDQSSLDALADYVDEQLAPGVFAEPAAPAAAPVVAAEPARSTAPPVVMTSTPGSVSGSETPVERLMREQLQAMNQLFAQQLDALRGLAPQGAPAAARSLSAPVVQASAATASSGSVVAPLSAAAPAKDAPKAHGPYRPVQKGPTGTLSSRQQDHLDALINRHAKRTAKSKSLTQQHRQHLADPRVVSGFRIEWKELVYPIVTVRSQGSRLWDVDGNEYIDLVNGFGQIMLGHRPDFVERAVEKQLREGFEIGPQTPLAGEVAELFCAMTGNERMTFCNTGSEAVMAAMRVARTVTARSKVVMFSGDYHGMFDEVLVKGFMNKAGVPQSVPIAPGIPRESVSNIVVLEYGAEESLNWIRANASELAAVLVEPVQSRHPGLRPVEFLRELRKITQASGTALVFDEVVTGFRVHQGGCQAVFGIEADLATYGKVVAGGMPIGVLAGKAQFMDALDGGMWQYGDASFPEVGMTFFAGTFVRHPLAVAAAKAVLEHLKAEGPALQEKLAERTGRLARALSDFVEQRSIPAKIEGFGSFFYLSFPPEERFASLFYLYMRDKGVHIREGFPCFLTTAHSDADFDAILTAFKESFAQMQEAGFFITREAPKRDAATERVDRPAAERIEQAPFTEPQLEVWLSDQLSEAASCSYNESFSLDMRGTVDEAAVKQALAQVVARHDALRASFSPEGDVQRFAAHLDLDVPTVDLTGLTPTEREARLRQIIRDDAHTPFRLSEGPLVRAKLVKQAAGHHTLIFTAHHIVCDGWSSNVILDELSQLYNARVEGTRSSLPEPMSFGTYAKSQAEFVASPEGEKTERYWLEQFKELPPPLDLPLDRARPAVKEFNGATYRRKFDKALLDRVKKFGAKQKCTLFVTLLAGFQALLGRLSGQDDIVVGVPTAGQSLLDDAVLVGHAVNFIPLRGRLAGDPTAAAFLRQMQQTVLAGYEYQNYTYGRLVRKLALPRDPSRLPLTEIQFNLERLGEGLRFSGFTAEVDPNPKSFVNFDIFLNIVESKDGLLLDCDYNTGLFDAETIARWLEHYEALLEGMAADAEVPISKLPLLDDGEKRDLVSKWNGPRVALPRDAFVHHLIEKQVDATPQATAVVFEGEELTYAELDRRANQLANHLRKLGVKPGTRVGVFVERSLDMIVALLGTLKSGGAYVPLDPTFPPDRLRYVLEDAAASVVLTQSALTKAWTFGRSTVVSLDKDWDTIANAGDARPKPLGAATDLAYVIYTSGSTGKPKGVEIPHRAVVNLLRAMVSEPGLEKSDVFAAVTTLSFDIAGLELYLPLSVGAKLAIVSREKAQYGVQLLEYLKSIKATVMQATPVTWKQLLDAGWSGNPALKVLCGGEAFPQELARELTKRAASVWNMYGPTETTIWSAVAKVHVADGPVAIGRPIANTQFYVLDKSGGVAPMGVLGELYIAGEGLARGYHDRSELTAEKFVANPFAEEPGARMYRTGDLVRRRGDGTLEFLGRLDDQIKLRGFRVELGEIESALASHPSIREAVVLLREDEPGEQRLVGYIVVAGGTVLAAGDLRTFLLATLPAYMVPAGYVSLNGLPLTPNGKIDRRALPAPDWSKQSRANSYVEPRTDNEKVMASIWGQVLRLDQVGVNDNLFELGADSLHVFQIAARAGKAGISVTPQQILRYRTIGAILTEAAKQPSAKPQVLPIRAVAREKFRLAPQRVQ